MRIKDDFVLRQVADTWVVLPLATVTLDFNGMLTLNESGAMLWKVLEQGGDREAMITALTDAYEVTVEQAGADVEDFINKLNQVQCIEI